MVTRLDSQLSRVLLDEGTLTVDALEEATQQQVVHGGALDTLLLEMNLVDEGAIVRALTTAWGTTVVDTLALTVDKAEISRLLPERIAVSLALCPFRADDDGIHVLVPAPVDRGLLEEVGALVKRSLIPHVVPEVRVWQMLGRIYDANLDERFVSLLRHLDRVVDVSNAPARTAPRLSVRPPDPTETKWDLVEALAHLAAQDNRPGIADVAVRFGRQTLPFMAIFGVRDGLAIGWQRSGAADGPQFESVSLPIPSGSVLAQVLESPSPLLGKPPVGDGNSALFGWLGRRRPRTALLVPIIVARRPVAVLYGDGGVRPRSADVLADLVAFGARLGAAFEALLRARHRAHPEIFERATAKGGQPSTTGKPASSLAGLKSASATAVGADASTSTSDLGGGAAESLLPASLTVVEEPAPQKHDGTSPFARGYVAPTPKIPISRITTTPTLKMDGDGAWNLVMERREQTTSPVDTDEIRSFVGATSSSEIASFERGPTSTEIASFESGDPTRVPDSQRVSDVEDGEESIVLDASVTRAMGLSSEPPSETKSLGSFIADGMSDDDDDDVTTSPVPDTAEVSGMYRIVPQKSEDLDEAAFSAAEEIRKKRAADGDEVDRVSASMDQSEAGGFVNLFVEKKDDVSTWKAALKTTVEAGLQGGTSGDSEAVLVDEDDWEPVVLDRAYNAVIAQGSVPAKVVSDEPDDGDDVDDDAPVITGVSADDDDASHRSDVPLDGQDESGFDDDDLINEDNVETLPPTAADSGPTAKELVAMLESLQATRIEDAKIGLKALGRDALPALIDAFPGRLLIDPFAKDVVVEKCSDLGPLVALLEELGPLGIDVAVAHLDARFPAHRYCATFLFVVIPDERALELLRPRLHDNEERIRTIATVALTHYVAHPKFHAVLTHLRQRLESTNADSIERAALLLGNFRDVAAIPTLMTLVDDRNSMGRAAHGALVQITLQDFGTKQKAWAKWWDKARRETRIDWLIEALSNRDREIRFVASMELAQITGEDFGYDCDGAKRDREAAIKNVIAWWSSERAAIGV